MGLGTPDCPDLPGMYDYVSLAGGASVTGARLILTGDAWRRLQSVRRLPPRRSRQAAGFCYVNDVVLAALVFADAGKRVLFLDLDVHHCDGVQDAFYSRTDVMTISLHESGRTLFPGTRLRERDRQGRRERVHRQRAAARRHL